MELIALLVFQGTRNFVGDFWSVILMMVAIVVIRKALRNT